ncbi:MAG: DUF4160 domain-containing protein [Clostridia bacterium]|nr:DUF4160 domain-containing protein [Clostridia bacterium]
MPTVSRFLGIVIRIYPMGKEHNPPHFHAIYNEDVASINIQTGEVIEGHLSGRVMALVLEWLNKHRDELLEIWTTQEWKQIDPLD